MRFPVISLLLIASIAFMFGCNGAGTSKGSADPAATSFSFDLKFSQNNMCSGPFPAVSLKGVPPGTETLKFSMIDLDYGNKDHGQGQVKYEGNDALPEGKVPGIMGPCMESSNAHKYKITLEALSKDGKVIETTTRAKSFSK